MFFQDHGESIVTSRKATFDFPSHLHTDIEIMICTDGTLHARCNEHEKTLYKGDVMISFPNDIHSYKKTQSGEGIMIIFHPNISSLITSTSNGGQFSNFIHKPEVIQVAEELCRSNNNPTNFSVIYGYLHVIFGMLLSKTHSKKPSPIINTFHSAIRYISLNYTKKITLKEVSKSIGISHSHLSRLFSEKIDGGFKNYLKILRVEKAKNLLKTTDLSVYQILLESGFSDQKTFNRVFKSETGTNPREYRNKHSVCRTDS